MYSSRPAIGGESDGEIDWEVVAHRICLYTSGRETRCHQRVAAR